MTHYLRRAVSLGAITAGLAIATAHVSAAPPPNSTLDPTVTVNFGELNTSTAEGTRVLYDRLSAAARAVCAAGGEWYPRVYFAQRECYRATLDHVVARLNLPRLTVLHRARTRDASGTPHLQARNR